MALVSALIEILNKPTIGDVVYELMVFMVPIWVAIVAGVLVGWAWKPKWAKLNMDFLDCSTIRGDSISQFAASLPNLRSLKLPFASSRVSDSRGNVEITSLPSSSNDNSRLLKLENEKQSVVNANDLKHLHRLIKETDGGPSWIQMMDKSTSNMSYQAWRRDPETGPPQYRSKTVYEDATPEMLRDFFWDDEFRLKWDDMLLHAKTLEECPVTGTMVVHWVRKFPFFCSDREYIIGRRIWQCGETFYCVTKGVPCASVPRCNTPRRVDLYYSSWCIRTAESKRDGRPTACEVLLFHHEDMGIPWEIAKLGIRRGMWGAVKKIDPGLRAYQEHLASGPPLSSSASMAQINTKVDVNSLDNDVEFDNTQESSSDASENAAGRNMTKLVLIGGAIAIACTIDKGLFTKAFVFGVARRFARAGRRL